MENSMADTASDFVQQGLRYYPDAFAAMTEFRRLCEDRIIARLRARTWRNWRPRLETVTRSKVSTYCWVGAWAQGLVDGADTPVDVETAVWWNSRELSATRAFCILVHRGPEWLANELVRTERVGVEYVEADYGYLFIRDDSEAPDLEAIFDRLFAAFDECIGASAQAHKGQAGLPAPSAPA